MRADLARHVAGQGIAPFRVLGHIDLREIRGARFSAPRVNSGLSLSTVDARPVCQRTGARPTAGNGEQVGQRRLSPHLAHQRSGPRSIQPINAPSNSATPTATNASTMTTPPFHEARVTVLCRLPVTRAPCRHRCLQGLAVQYFAVSLAPGKRKVDYLLK
jgi:hypothetical protein